MRKRIVVIIILIVSILLSGACFAWFCFRGETGRKLIADDEEADLYCELYCLADSKPTNAILCGGKVISASVSEIVLNPNFQTIKNLYVKEGDYVERGDILWSYDISEIQDEISEIEYQSQIETDEAENDNGRIIRELDNAIADRKKQLDDVNEKIARIRYEKEEKEDALINAQRKQDQLSNSDYHKSNNLDDYQSSDYDAAYEDADLQDNRSKTDEELDENISFEIETLKSEVQDLNSELNEALDELNEIDRSTAETIEECRLEAEFGETKVYSESAELYSLYDKLGQADVHAPQSGIISALNIGDTAVSDAAAAEISDTNSIRIEIEANQFDVAQIYEGMETLICMDTITGIKGVVAEIIKTPIRNEEEENTESKYKVIVDLVSNCESLFIGMDVNVFLLKENKVFPYEVPEDYIYVDDYGSYIITAENISENQYRAKKRYVQKGICYDDEKRAEINFDGISGKTLVVPNSFGEPADGDMIYAENSRDAQDLDDPESSDEAGNEFYDYSEGGEYVGGAG